MSVPIRPPVMRRSADAEAGEIAGFHVRQHHRPLGMARRRGDRPVELAELERWVRRRNTAQAQALRARIVLASAAGESDIAVAARPGTTRVTVGRWRRRFVAARCDGLLDEARPGAPRKIGDADVERVVTKRRSPTTSISTAKTPSHSSARNVGRPFRQLWSHSTGAAPGVSGS